jgi:hypothetical protein
MAVPQRWLIVVMQVAALLPQRPQFGVVQGLLQPHLDLIEIRTDIAGTQVCGRLGGVRQG